MVKLKLYISSHSEKSRLMIKRLKGILESAFSTEYSLDVVDVLNHPDLAEDEGVFATHTLLKYAPEPRVRLIGDVGDDEKLLEGLTLKA